MHENESYSVLLIFQTYCGQAVDAVALLVCTFWGLEKLHMR